MVELVFNSSRIDCKFLLDRISLFFFCLFLLGFLEFCLFLVVFLEIFNLLDCKVFIFFKVLMFMILFLLLMFGFGEEFLEKFVYIFIYLCFEVL